MPASRPHDIRLQQIRIASPCGEPWHSMRGDERVRHCDRCNLNVYNFAAMTAGEVSALLDGAGERLCGRIFRRTDGTILLRDCPTGFAAVRRKVVRGAALAATLLVSTVAGIAAAALRDRTDLKRPPGIAESLGHFPAFAAVARWSALHKSTPPPPPGPALMGDIAGDWDVTAGVVLLPLEDETR